MNSRIRGFSTASVVKGQSYYEILGVRRDASTRTIKKQFFELSKKYHPDKTRGLDDAAKRASTSKFQSIKEAYDVLSDASARAVYNSSLPGERGGSSAGSSHGSGSVHRNYSAQHIRRTARVHNYGRPFATPDPADPLNPANHVRSNYDVPHFDYDTHLRQQQGYDAHRRQRNEERQAAYEEHEAVKRAEEFRRREEPWSFATVGAVSAAAVFAVIVYFW